MIQKIDKQHVQEAVQEAYERFKGVNEGKNADYIPYLANVPANLFGIAACLPDGEVIAVGDTDYKFGIESVSKVPTAILAMNQYSASRLFDFSKVLGVPINYFFSDLDNMTEQNSHSLFCRQPGQGEEDDFDDPLCREESRVLAAAYYKIADRSIAKTLFELMKALSRPNERTVEKQD